MKNTGVATNLQLVMIPISENIGTAIPLGSSFTGNAHKAKMVTSPDGRFLALSYSKGTPSGWFNATTGGNEIRTYQLDTDYTTATDLGAQAIPAVADIHSMSFNADCSYMYYTASSETDGHKLYRIETTANAVPEALEALGGYAELSTDKNGRFYAVVSNTNILKTITHSATPQVTDITLDLPVGYTLTGAMPLQPHRIYANENVDDIYVRTLGNKQYELKDHLGNVRAVISDRKLSTLSGTIPGDFNADLLASYNYYPFGMNMPGRTFNPSEYRYGFQGQEKDTETGLVNYKFRMHDPRIGRFFAVDPLAAKYPFYSPYAFSGNRVIDAIELEGLEPTSYLLTKLFGGVGHVDLSGEADVGVILLGFKVKAAAGVAYDSHGNFAVYGQTGGFADFFGALGGPSHGGNPSTTGEFTIGAGAGFELEESYDWGLNNVLDLMGKSYSFDIEASLFKFFGIDIGTNRDANHKTVGVIGEQLLVLFPVFLSTLELREQALHFWLFN